MDEQNRRAIEWECEKLVREFALLNDAQRWDDVAGLFTENGVFARPTAPDKPLTGRRAIAEAFRARPAGRITRHFCANTVITVEAADRAAGITYILLFTGRQGELDAGPVADPVPLVGEYRDRFRRDEDGWHFEERHGALCF